MRVRFSLALAWHRRRCMTTLAVVALLSLTAIPLVATPQAEQQNSTRVLVGSVSADWSWEPRSQPLQPPMIVAPELTRSVVPGYPPSRTRDGYQGHVIIEATIDTNGRVTEPSVLRTPADGIFDATVLEALGEWSFEPASREGEPVAVTGIFTMRFEIRQWR